MIDQNTFYWILVFSPLAPLAILFYLFRRRRGQKTRWFIVGWNLGLVILLISALFLGLETYYRFFDDSTDSFGVNMITKRWFKRHYQFNNVGFRDNVDYQLQRDPAKKHRISFIGDSFTAGHGIKNVDDRFANLIRAEYPDWEVHCLAVNGYNSIQELRLVKQLAARGYRFDYVVLCYCLNDIADFIPGETEAEKKAYSDCAANLTGIDTLSYFLNTWHSRMYVSHDALLGNYYGFVKNAYAGAPWQEEKACLEQIAQTVQQSGGHLLVVTLPFFNAYGDGKYGYQGVHEQLDVFWNSMHIPNLDLMQAYIAYAPQQLTVNRFDPHPNELANKLAAQRIADFISAHLDKPEGLNRP